MTDDERTAERERLQAKLAASRGKEGYGARVKAIEEALAALDAG